MVVNAHAYFFWERVRFLVFFGVPPEGSPVAAFSTSPPPSRAMSARNLWLRTERGASAVISFFEAYLSRCLMSSQDLSARLPNPLVRINAHEPRNFRPARENLKSPFCSEACGSAVSGVHVPVSQNITVPPPYSPSGMTPSKLPYSRG